MEITVKHYIDASPELLLLLRLLATTSVLVPPQPVEVMAELRAAAADPVASKSAPEEAVTQPAPPAKAPRAATTRIWSPERDALAKAAFMRGDNYEEIRIAANKLPGPTIETPKAVKSHIHKLGAARSPEYIAALNARRSEALKGYRLPAAVVPQPHAQQPSPAQPPPVAPATGPAAVAAPPASTDYGVTEATFAEIRRWALRYAVDFNGTNIGAVNKLRKQCKLPNFVQVASQAA